MSDNLRLLNSDNTVVDFVSPSETYSLDKDGVKYKNVRVLEDKEAFVPATDTDKIDSISRFFVIDNDNQLIAYADQPNDWGVQLLRPSQENMKDYIKYKSNKNEQAPTNSDAADKMASNAVNNLKLLSKSEKEVNSLHEYILCKLDDGRQLKDVTFAKNKTDDRGSSPDCFIIDLNTGELLAYALKPDDEPYAILTASPSDKNLFKAQYSTEEIKKLLDVTRKQNQPTADETPAKAVAADTKVESPPPTPPAETEVQDEKREKAPIALKDINLTKLDGLKEGDSFRLRYTDGIEKPVTLKFYDTGEMTAAFVGHDNHEEIHYHAIMDKKGNLEWKKGAPEKAAEVLEGLNLSDDHEKSSAPKATPAPADAAAPNEKEKEKEEPKELKVEKSESNPVGIAFNALLEVAFHSANAREKGGIKSIINTQAWEKAKMPPEIGGGYDKAAQEIASFIGKASDKLVDSYRYMAPLALGVGVVSSAPVLGVVAALSLAAGAMILKGRRTYNDMNVPVGESKSETLGFTKALESNFGAEMKAAKIAEKAVTYGGAALGAAAVVTMGISTIGILPIMAVATVGGLIGAGYVGAMKVKKEFDGFASAVKASREKTASTEKAL